MIREKRKWLTYTYFDRDPGLKLNTVHLFSPVKKKITGMIRIPFPTMYIDLKNGLFLDTWSKSARYKVGRAEKENLSIKRDADLLPDILNLFMKTAQLKGLRGHETGDFNSRPWIQCSAVFSDHKILAGHVWVMDHVEKRSLLFVNASDHQDEENDSALIGRAHYYLLWQDGLFLHQLGIETMDLHGYDLHIKDPALTGVYAWKEGTHGRQEVLYHYYPLHIYWLRKFRNMVAG